jgi:hypothetical protein
MLDSRNSGDNPSNLVSPNDNPSLTSPNAENSTYNKSMIKRLKLLILEDDVPF